MNKGDRPRLLNLLEFPCEVSQQVETGETIYTGDRLTVNRPDVEIDGNPSTE